MKFEDLARAAKSPVSNSAHIRSYRKTSNEKLANLVDIIFNKILDLMGKDMSKNSIEKMIIIKGAQNLKPSTKKYIMLNMSMDDARDIVERAKREIESE